jgi:hypothetical protein
MNEAVPYRIGLYTVRRASYQIHDGSGNPTGWIPGVDYWWDEGPATVHNWLALSDPVSTQEEANRLALLCISAVAR